jgi:hypothetical protein
MPSLYGTNPQVIAVGAFDTTAPTRFNFNPFHPDSPCKAVSVAGGTLYLGQEAPKPQSKLNPTGLSSAYRDDQPRRVRFIADGTKKTWSWDSGAGTGDSPALINLHDDGAALSAANYLGLVVLVNGVPLLRRQSDVAMAALAGTKAAVAGGVYTLTVHAAAGAAYGAGSVIDVLMDPDLDWITSVSLTAGVIKEVALQRYAIMATTESAAVFAP